MRRSCWGVLIRAACTSAVAAMNAKAQLLGMHDTHFADPTGLSSDNRSSPTDLVQTGQRGL